MVSFNRIIMIGNLTRDPDYKVQSSGQAVCKLSLASNRQFRNKQTGAMTQEVCYIDVDVWGAQAENCKQYLSKGRSVLIEGRLKLDTWESEGQIKRRHSIVADRIVFLGFGQQSENTIIDSVAEEPLVSPATSPIDTKAKKKKVKSENDILANNSSDILFKDEPPFEDDLPF